jgi:heme/copper-type cytochrome/quinol oxidase subunit 2
MRKEFIPGAAVLGGVLLFWAVAVLGNLSFLSAPKPPLATLAWLIFVYAAVAITPIVGGLAVADLVRRWQRNRNEGTRRGQKRRTEGTNA